MLGEPSQLLTIDLLTLTNIMVMLAALLESFFIHQLLEAKPGQLVRLVDGHLRPALPLAYLVA
eukprot:1060284-Prymnesium_polylepis.1